MREILGWATATFSILERRESNPIIDRGNGADPIVQTTALAGSGFTEPVYDACGIRATLEPHGTGVAAVSMSDYVVNSLGALQGGVLIMLADAATTTAVAAAVEAPVGAVDFHVDYLALAKVGPIRATATPMRIGDGFGVADVVIADDGAEPLRVTTATTSSR